MRWPSAKFAEVAEIVTGNTPPKKDPDNYGSGVPWVKPPDLDAWEPVTQTAETLSSKGQKLARLLPEGTVMVCCIGSIGRVGIAGTTVATNQQINSLIFGPNINPKFGYYYCRRIPQQFKAAARNAVVPILNKSNFSKIEMPVPPLSEQRRIVEILDQANALRKKRAEADAIAARILPALFYEMFGDPLANPHGFAMETVGNLLTFLRNGTTAEQNQDGHGYPVTRIETISAGVINPDRVRYVDFDDSELNKWRLRPGDILFSHINSESHIGKTAIYKGQPDPLIHGMNLLLMRPDARQVRPEYLFAVLNTDSVRAAYRQRCKRAVNQASLNQKDISSLEIAVPPIDAQDRFCLLAGNLLQQVETQQKATENIEKLFDNLIHRAFTGDLTAKWREAHMKELLQEMEQQAKELKIDDCRSQIETDHKSQIINHKSSIGDPQ